MSSWPWQTFYQAIQTMSLFFPFVHSQNDYGGGGYGSSSYGGAVKKEVHEKVYKSSAYQTSSGSGGYGIKSSSGGYGSSLNSSYGGVGGYGTVAPLVNKQTSYGIKSGPSYGSSKTIYSNEVDGGTSYEFKSYKKGGSSAELKKSAMELQSGSGSVEMVRKTCTKKPKAITNASVKCTLLTNTCKAKCIENYQFPSGETMLKVICDAGEWALEKLEWSKNLACERKLIIQLKLHIHIRIVFITYLFVALSYLYATM